MSIEFTIRALDAEDYGFALKTWRDSAKESPNSRNVPWNFYKSTVGVALAGIINAPTTKLLGAYDNADRLLGWLAMTPGKRINVCHWVSIKFELDGERLRRRGIAAALIEHADLGPRFIYTMRARKHREQLTDGTMSKSLDEVLADKLQAGGVTATYIALKTWLT